MTSLGYSHFRICSINFLDNPGAEGLNDSYEKLTEGGGFDGEYTNEDFNTATI